MADKNYLGVVTTKTKTVNSFEPDSAQLHCKLSPLTQYRVHWPVPSARKGTHISKSIGHKHRTYRQLERSRTITMACHARKILRKPSYGCQTRCKRQ